MGATRDGDDSADGPPAKRVTMVNANSPKSMTTRQPGRPDDGGDVDDGDSSTGALSGEDDSFTAVGCNGLCHSVVSCNHSDQGRGKSTKC